MTNLRANNERNVWEQWDWVWHIIAYASLGLNIIFTLGSIPTTRFLLLFLGLSALLALWYLPFVGTPITRWRDVPQRGIFYFLVGWFLWAGLLSIDERALLLTGMFYPLLFTRFPPRWALPVAFLQTMGLYLLFLLIYRPGNWLTFLVITLVMLITASLIGIFISSIINQSVKRQLLLDELTQTRVSLLKAERESGVLAERQRLAREIHDTLAQQFTSIIMLLTAAQLSDPATTQTHVQQAEQTARDGLDEARRMIWDMRPRELEGASLVESLESLVARWSIENPIKVAMTITGDPQPLDPSIDHALLRISQEALQNIKKHAGAQNVNITLSYMPDIIALDIADDGQGYEDQGFIYPQKRRGFGLKSMQERTEAIGGELCLESEPGKGAKIAVLIPLSDQD